MALLFGTCDNAMTSDRAAALDFITIYSNSFHLTQQSINGENDYGFSEFATRRELVNKALKNMVIDGLMVVHRDEFGLVASFAQDFAIDINSYATDEDENEIEYHPREYFDEDFQSKMTEYAVEILSECNYENLTSARFDMSVFDIEVNGESKENSNGKGYRAFLNTVVILMFRKYLFKYAKFDPRMFIIDTPLHGFDEGRDETAPESMRTALFQYFINHQSEGQLIIIENLDHIPRLPYKESGATVTKFVKGREPGRYGFLNDVR